MSKCIMCKNEVDWKEVRAEFDEEISPVDVCGETCLTEALQYVYHGQICSRACYDALLDRDF